MDWIPHSAGADKQTALAAPPPRAGLGQRDGAKCVGKEKKRTEEDKRKGQKERTKGKDKRKGQKERTKGKDKRKGQKERTKGKDKRNGQKERTKGKDKRNGQKERTKGKGSIYLRFRRDTIFPGYNYIYTCAYHYLSHPLVFAVDNVE